jgi:tRNA dimethylallyltransferase
MRVENQFKNGLIEEVKKLLEMGYPPELPSMKSLGYREVMDFLNSKMTLEEAKKLIVSNTVKFSKRQMTWFKRDKEIVWIDS